MKKKIKKSTIINIAITIATYIIVMVLINGDFLSRKMTALLIPVCVNIMLAVSLNLLTGFLGELTLGHAGFMAIGAYIGSIITLNLNLAGPIEFAIALLAGGLLAALFGFLIGVPVLRLRGDYLAIVTLGFGEIIKSVINSIKITNGPLGLSQIPKYSDYKSFTLVFIITVITVILISNLVKSRHGRAIMAIRDNDIAAEASGIPVSKFKVMTFVISAFFAGVAGVIFAHNVSIIKPVTFSFNKSIDILVIVVLGGMGSIKGSIIAAIILTILPEMLRGFSDYRMLIYSLVLIFMMIFNSSGMKDRFMEQPKVSAFLSKFKKKEAK